MRFLSCSLLAILVLTNARPQLQAEAATGVSSLVIGLLLPPEEPEAANLRQGIQIAVAHANQLPGATVSLLVRGRVGQWGTDGEEAGRMVLDDGVRGLIAPPSGAASHLALQIAGRTATPVISLCADSSVVGAGIPWMVRIVPGTREEAQLLFATFRTSSQGRPFRWGAVVPIERAGREAASDLRAAAEAAVCSLDKPVEVSSKLKNFSDLTTQLLAPRPDGILLWLEAPGAGALAKSLRAAGFRGQLVGPGRLQSAAFAAHAGSAVDGFVLARPVLEAASQSVADRFVAAYRQQFGTEPDTTTRLAYDAAVLLTNLLRKSGDHPPRAAFPITGEQSGVSGNLKFDQAGNRLVPLELVQFRDGRFTPLAGKTPAALTP